ncbi:MAG: hypothetical protein LBI04_08015, partial [Treponema sp.]|nr:hypothetical protein [Treponema sp.]
MFRKTWVVSFVFAAVFAPAAFAAEDTPAASRVEGVTIHYYATLNEAFEAAAGTSINTPDEITVLSDIILDEPIIIDTTKHIRLVAADGSKTIQRGSGNLDDPLFWLTGEFASLTLGKPYMGSELSSGGSLSSGESLVIDGGYLNTPPIQALAPLISVNGKSAKLIMYDNVFLQNNYNSGTGVGPNMNKNGAGVFLRADHSDTENHVEFIMKGGTIRGNINNTQ